MVLTTGGAAAGPASVGVIGLGLIGGSLARALAGAGRTVVAVDADRATLAQADRAGLGVVEDIAALVAARPDVIVLCVPLRTMRPVAAELARELRAARHAPVVTDVGSVKGAVREAVRGAGVAHYVGAHPMAGTESSGFGASSAELILGVRWAVTVDQATAAVDAWTVLSLITGPLRGSVRVLSDDAHDEAVALISHVPHVVATELLSLVAAAPVRDVALGLAAGSFRDGTRVGRTEPRRTEAMVTDNAMWVASGLRVVLRDLERLVAELESNAPVAAFFDRPDPVRAMLDAASAPASAGEQAGAAGEHAGAADEHAGAAGRFRLEGAWARELTDLGRSGAVVIGVDGEDLVLR